MASNKIQFRSIQELKDPTLTARLAQKEFQTEIPVDELLGGKKATESGTSRRDFLKLLGFSTAAVTLAACEAPVIKSIPYVVKPHEIIGWKKSYRFWIVSMCFFKATRFFYCRSYFSCV